MSIAGRCAMPVEPATRTKPQPRRPGSRRRRRWRTGAARVAGEPQHGPPAGLLRPHDGQDDVRWPDGSGPVADRERTICSGVRSNHTAGRLRESPTGQQLVEVRPQTGVGAASRRSRRAVSTTATATAPGRGTRGTITEVGGAAAPATNSDVARAPATAASTASRSRRTPRAAGASASSRVRSRARRRPRGTASLAGAQADDDSSSPVGAGVGESIGDRGEHEPEQRATGTADPSRKAPARADRSAARSASGPLDRSSAAWNPPARLVPMRRRRRVGRAR